MLLAEIVELGRRPIGLERWAVLEIDGWLKEEKRNGLLFGDVHEALEIRFEMFLDALFPCVITLVGLQSSAVVQECVDLLFEDGARG
jgi:hypothetical protein